MNNSIWERWWRWTPNRSQRVRTSRSLMSSSIVGSFMPGAPSDRRCFGAGVKNLAPPPLGGARGPRCQECHTHPQVWAASGTLLSAMGGAVAQRGRAKAGRRVAHRWVGAGARGSAGEGGPALCPGSHQESGEG